MKYLVTTVYSERDHVNAPSYFLLPIKPQLLETLESLMEAAEELRANDDGIVSVKRWSPVQAHWATGYDEDLQDLADERATTEFTDEELEALDLRNVDCQTLHVRPPQGLHHPSAYMEGRQGSVRVESREFTLDDLQKDPS